MVAIDHRRIDTESPGQELGFAWPQFRYRTRQAPL